MCSIDRVDIILTHQDKTGTLTQNKMTVTNVNIGNTVYDADKGDKIETFQSNLSKSVYSKYDIIIRTNLPFNVIRLITNITINSSANVLVQNNQKVVSGSASEIALLEFVQNMDVDIEKERWNETVSKNLLLLLSILIEFSLFTFLA
jgi:magnesium-transporting ATPase (P-type)